jgi:hypothetical protein
MHETRWRKEVADWMRRKWPKDTFIEESFLPYGSKQLENTWGQPDILRICPNGSIHIVEVKRFDNQELEKWLVLGQLHFYTFLVDTQYYQDNKDFKWMAQLIINGLHCQSKINAIEERFKRRSPVVESWCIVVAGGSKKDLERNDRLWHMHDYVNQQLNKNTSFRPLYIYFASKTNCHFRCAKLSSWFHK